MRLSTLAASQKGHHPGVSASVPWRCHRRGPDKRDAPERRQPQPGMIATTLIDRTTWSSCRGQIRKPGSPSQTPAQPWVSDTPLARFRAGSGALAPVDGQDRLGGVWGEIGLRTRSCPLAGPLRGTLSGRALPLRGCPSQTTPHKVKTPAPIANCYVAASAGSG